MSPGQAAALRALEEALLEPDVRRSPDRLGRLLADEFIEIGISGSVSDKRQTIDAPIATHMEMDRRSLADGVPPGNASRH